MTHFFCLLPNDQVSRNLTDDDGNNLWPEFLKFLFDLASSESVDMKESSLLLFGACPTIFGDQNSTYIDVIKNMLMSSLGHPSRYCFLHSFSII